MSSCTPLETPTPADQAVLFVDDEPKVLSGLERMLRPLRRDWRMFFAGSGQAALELLARERIDVLVTDMRMPQMNGAELMQHVLERHPGVIRMALSGHAEREVVVRAVQLAHQYLSKPCDGTLLRDRLAQAMRLKQLLDSPTLRSMLSSLTSLRAMPAMYAEITAELQSANPSVARVADIVARDPAMTAKILQLINSAYFGLRGCVSDPVRAVQLLGLETVRTLVLSTHVYTRFPASGVINPGEIWQHSLRTARDAKAIAHRLRLPERDANEAFSAGLLHDVGKLVLAETVSDYEAVVLEARASGTPLAAAERRAFGASHPEVAAYLFGLWGLSYGIVEAIAWHHGPGEAGHAAPSTLTAVHVANAVDHTRTFGLDLRHVVDQVYLVRVGVAEEVSAWFTELAAATA